MIHNSPEYEKHAMERGRVVHMSADEFIERQLENLIRQTSLGDVENILARIQKRRAS